MLYFSYFVCCVLLFVFGIVSPFVYSCLFPISEQVYRPLPPSGNPLSVSNYHIGMMEHAKCKHSLTTKCLHRNDRSDVTADNRANLNTVLTAHHVLCHHPLTNTCAVHCVYQITYYLYLVTGRVSVSTDSTPRGPSLNGITLQHIK